jgi:hypothetical protein
LHRQRHNLFLLASGQVVDRVPRRQQDKFPYHIQN